jgi:hypothetical protein
MTKTKWFIKAKDEEHKKEVRAQLVAAAPALKLLRTILLDDMNNKEYNQRKPDYDSNWALKQADTIGSIRTLREVIDLITIEELND